MNLIASFFLRAKHWQMFLLLFGLLFISKVAVIRFDLPTVRSPEEFRKACLLFGVPWALLMICFLVWLWSMGAFLSSVAPSSWRLRGDCFASP